MSEKDDDIISSSSARSTDEDKVLKAVVRVSKTQNVSSSLSKLLSLVYIQFMFFILANDNFLLHVFNIPSYIDQKVYQKATWKLAIYYSYDGIDSLCTLLRRHQNGGSRLLPR